MLLPTRVRSTFPIPSAAHVLQIWRTGQHTSRHLRRMLHAAVHGTVHRLLHDKLPLPQHAWSVARHPWVHVSRYGICRIRTLTDILGTAWFDHSPHSLLTPTGALAHPDAHNTLLQAANYILQTMNEVLGANGCYLWGDMYGPIPPLTGQQAFLQDAWEEQLGVLLSTVAGEWWPHDEQCQDCGCVAECCICGGFVWSQNASRNLSSLQRKLLWDHVVHLLCCF